MQGCILDFFYLKVRFMLFAAAITNVFLLVISSVVSNREPSSLHFFQLFFSLLILHTPGVAVSEMLQVRQSHAKIYIHGDDIQRWCISTRVIKI